MASHHSNKETKVLNKHEKRLKKKESKKHKASTTHQDKKQEKKKRIISIVIIFLMVASVFGIWASSKSQQSQELTYQGHKFRIGFNPNNDQQQVAFTKVNGKDVFFYSLPQDSLNLNTSGNLTKVFDNSQYIIITSDPNDQTAPYYDLIRYEISQFSTKQIYGAITNNKPNINLPLVTCLNATESTPIIELSTSNTTSIKVENNCIRVKGKIEDFMIIRDRLLYSLLDIVNE